jgi:hypothetical protein
LRLASIGWGPRRQTLRTGFVFEKSCNGQPLEDKLFSFLFGLNSDGLSASGYGVKLGSFRHERSLRFGTEHYGLGRSGNPLKLGSFRFLKALRDELRAES